MTRTRKQKKIILTKSKFRSPTSLSIFPERSPQLQDKEPNVLNSFTTKNISVNNKSGQQWNTVENNKLAYKRSARGSPAGSYPKINYGPVVERLTKQNYKKLNKGSELYYDRGSVVFRGPFTYHKTLRGPALLFTASDIGYKQNDYKFVLPVNKLKTEVLYLDTGKKSLRPIHKKKRKVKRTTAKRNTTKRTTAKRNTAKRNTAKRNTTKRSKN